MPLPRLSGVLAVAAGIALGGCFDRATALVWFPHAQFVTIADVDLHASQEEDATGVVARLAKGTVVTPIGQAGSDCNSCMRVDTPSGIGWLYTRYLAPVPPAE
ncbi:MAG TPA: hypothetical protein VG651_07610 [Stellaceae bacterium]|nr:hypothetical protein [Stellaceae bacterium]